MILGSSMCGTGLPVSISKNMERDNCCSRNSPILGAEHFADDGGMILSNIDMSYLGVHSIWTNNLGKYMVPFQEHWLTSI